MSKKNCTNCTHCYEVKQHNGWYVWWCTRFPEWKELNSCRGIVAGRLGIKHWCAEFDVDTESEK